MRAPRNFWIVAVIMALVLAGCKGKKDDENGYLENTVEGALDALAGVLDDAGNDQFAELQLTPLERVAKKMSEALIPSACAAGEPCWTYGRAVTKPCVDGIQSVSYPSCIFLNVFSIDGDVSLTHYQSDGLIDEGCIFEDGDYIIREFDLTRTNTRLTQRVLKSNSNEHENYLGDVIGGGGKLTKIDESNWEFEVIGKHVFKTVREQKRFDISLKTGEPIGVSGTLARSGRVVDGGSLIIYHNLAEYTAIWEPHNLEYRIGCRFPVSGTADITFEGSVEGSITITFRDCGRFVTDDQEEVEIDQ